MLTLGEIYTNQKEFTKAFEWFQKAANAGSNEGRFRLARLYEEGVGTQVNIGLAKLLYLEIMNTAKASRQDSRNGQTGQARAACSSRSEKDWTQEGLGPFPKAAVR